MRTDVSRDWNWSDRYLLEVRRILLENALYFLTVQIADEKQDLSEATDMIVIGNQSRIAVRLRRAAYGYRDLTLRAERSSGVTTELDKVRAGFSDFYLYGWTNESRIQDWMLVDMNHLRASGLLQRNLRIIPNRDKRTGFIAIPYSVLRHAGCIANSNMQQRKELA